MHDTPTNLPMNRPMSRTRSRHARLWMIPVRSLMPLLAILIIAGTLLWGPWVSLAIAVALHFVVERTL